jgi:hypothetical protein
MRPLSPLFANALARLLALLAAAILVACATVEVSPDIRFVKMSGASPTSESSAIVGFYSRISEGPLLYNVGARIVSIDGVDVAAWHGAVFEAAVRKIVIRFEAAGSQRSEYVPLTLSARPGHRYLVVAADSAPVENKLTKNLTFWIEDVDTREVVVGRRPPPAVNIDKAKFQALYNQFRIALTAALS